MFFVFHNYEGREDYPSFIGMFDKHGALYKKRTIDLKLKGLSFELINKEGDGSCIYIVTNKEKIYKIDTNLYFKDYCKIPKLV